MCTEKVDDVMVPSLRLSSNQSIDFHIQCLFFIASDIGAPIVRMRVSVDSAAATLELDVADDFDISVGGLLKM
jgi:hypothetical protein